MNTKAKGKTRVKLRAKLRAKLKTERRVREFPRSPDLDQNVAKCQ
jgi:hypothetical protein